MTRQSRVPGVLLVAAVAMAAACARNPATGERQLSLIPTSQEIGIGRQASAEVAETVGLYQDDRVQRYVADLGRELAGRAERPNLPWTFQVVDDPAVNAFALPGGYIFVTRGLLAYLDNEAQLAAVVGHEIGHVTGKHAVDRLSKAALAQIGLGVGALLSEEVRRFAPLGSVGLGLLFLKFSREDEHEADELGFRYALRGGYDVRQMPAVFATLERVGGRAHGGGRLPEWLATHPAPARRIQRTQERIAALGAAPPGKTVDRAGYLRVVDGVVFGPDPRQGYFQENRFVHPELAMALSMPPGWRKLNLRNAVVATSPEGDAAVQLTVVGTAVAPDEALRRFLGQPGVQAQGQAARPVPSLPSAASEFAARSEHGERGEQREIAGLVAFVAHRGRTFQLLSYTAAARLPARAPLFRDVAGSFRAVSDPALLVVQPARLRVLAVPRPMTLAALAAERPAAAPLADLAIMNQVEPQTALAAGRLVKWVEGGPPAAEPPGPRPTPAPRRRPPPPVSVADGR